MTRVRDVMSDDVLTIEPEVSLAEAARIMAEEHYSGLPVASQGGGVLGVISASDIVEFSMSLDADRSSFPGRESAEWPGPLEWDGTDADHSVPDYFGSTWDDRWNPVAYIGDRAQPGWSSLGESTVAEIMTRTVVSITPEDDLTAAARRMLDAGVHRLLVLERGRLVGLVTTTDIVRAVARLGAAVRSRPAMADPAPST